jgi:putative DNA primase/helicase
MRCNAVIIDICTIVNVLGGDITGRDSANVPGPGHSKNDRSLSVIIDRRSGRIVVFSHAGDDWRTCKNYVFERLGLERGGGDCEQPHHHFEAAPDADKKKKTDVALKIWFDSIDPAGTIVEQYLRDHRGLSIADNLAGKVIRFNRSLYLDPSTRAPGMVCLFRNIETDEPCGIHRTFLNSKTAEKLERKMLGVAKDAAIKLDADSTISSCLIIGEGVETVLSAREAGLGPAWALGSSGGVGRFPILCDLGNLNILEENDLTSRRDVKKCALRYRGAGKPVNIITAQGGNDFNDAWKAARE